MPPKGREGKRNLKRKHGGTKKSVDIESPPEKKAVMAREEESICKLSDEKIRERLHSLFQSKDVEGLETVQKQIREGIHSEEERRDGFITLHGEALVYLREIEMLRTDNERPAELGTMIQSVGLGSSAGGRENRNIVDAVVTSCTNGDDNHKGGMLSHFFYRSFLKHVHNLITGGATAAAAPHTHNPSSGSDAVAPAVPAHNPATRDDPTVTAQLEHFNMKMALIWKSTKVGVVRHKNSRTGSTPEPAATSLMASFINQLIPLVFGNSITAGWASEYILHYREEKDGVTQVKNPRTDGMLVAADPLNENALRALVSMEAKLGTFDVSAEYQSRSNGCDAFAQKPPHSTPWPLVLLRFTLSQNGCNHASALAFVPKSPNTAWAVHLWEESGDSAIYNGVMAALLATKDFITQLQNKKEQLNFCSVLGNIAVQEKEQIVYKSFFNTDQRNHNIDLVKQFIDEKAEVVYLGNKGCFIKMKWVGQMLPDSNECQMCRFLEIAEELKRLHSSGNCHGDIRVSNFILGVTPAKLIDFDLAGQTNHHKYPKHLRTLLDGERHPDVEKAIESGNVASLVLKTDHDWHSLQGAMQCFTAKIDSYDKTWNDAIKNIKTISKSLQTADFTIVLKPDICKTKKLGTGSPKAQSN